MLLGRGGWGSESELYLSGMLVWWEGKQANKIFSKVLNFFKFIFNT